MNNSPIHRTASINLWTLGHRRFYSPMMRVPGGLPAADAMATPRVRPSLVPHRELGLTGGAAVEATVSTENRATTHAHGAP